MIYLKSSLCVSTRFYGLTFTLLSLRTDFLWLVETNTVFWKPDIKVGETGVFQLSLKAPSLVSLDKLPVASVRVDFSYEQLPSIVLVHSKEDPTTPSLPVRLVNIGQITHGGENVQHSTNLRWNADDLLIVAGIISIGMPSTVQVRCFPCNDLFHLLY